MELVIAWGLGQDSQEFLFNCALIALITRSVREVVVPRRLSHIIQSLIRTQESGRSPSCKTELVQSSLDIWQSQYCVTRSWSPDPCRRSPRRRMYSVRVVVLDTVCLGGVGCVYPRVFCDGGILDYPMPEGRLDRMAIPLVPDQTVGVCIAAVGDSEDFRPLDSELSKLCLPASCDRNRARDRTRDRDRDRDRQRERRRCSAKNRRGHALICCFLDRKSTDRRHPPPLGQTGDSLATGAPAPSPAGEWLRSEDG